MRRDQVNKFLGRNDFGFLPELWEMFLITGDQIICPRGVSAFQKNVVIGIGRDFEVPARGHEAASVPDELQQLPPKALPNMQFRSGEHLTVLFQYGPGDIPSRRLRHGKQQHGALQSGRLDGSGNQHICVDDKAEGKHYRFGL
jgi:hypothetical protein